MLAMRQKSFVFSLVGLFFLVFLERAIASPSLDQQYGFKNFVIAVLASPAEPIHSKQVEDELISQIQKRMRFSYQAAPSAELKKNLEAISGPSVAGNLTERLEIYRPTLQALKEKKTDAAILAELVRRDEFFDLTLTLVSIEPGEVMAQAVQKIDPPYSQDRMVQKTAQAFLELSQNIPFDGTVLKRDGYLVVLDGGKGTFAPGMRLPTFTLEKEEGKISFNETGQILVQKVEDNLSFGRVLVERKPLEVLSGNKIRLSEKLATNDVPELMQSVTDANRDPASELVADFEVTKGEVGRLAVNFGTDLVEFKNLASTGGANSSNVFFPGAQLEGELWFTSRWFMDMSLGFGYGKFANTVGQSSQRQSSSVSNFRLQFGYRMNILAPERGPVVYAKLGYGKQSYDLGTVEPLRFTSMTYGGMLLSGGVRVPYDDTLNLGAEINTLIFPSIAEAPYSSGSDPSKINCWDFVFKGTYSLNSKVDLEGRLIFRNAGANFDGNSDLPDPITQATQSSKILQLGVSYYF
jgi:hypothetical protein